MKLKHPESEITVEVDDRSADAYLSQGWVEASSKTSAAKDPKAKS